MRFRRFFQIALFSVIFQNSSSSKNNVCKTFEDYATIQNNKNCWYNPDVASTPENVAKNHGFQLQTHTVVTEDQYHLNLFRIQKQSRFVRRPPILLHHGFISTAMAFMITGNRSLAFQLAELGYDVWLANHRGNPYSSDHSTISIMNPEFWEFSFHEIALYDIPAVLEHINNMTKSKVIYIGHSMGTTIAFIYSSLKKGHAERHLKGIIALSPVASFKFMSTPLRPFFPYLKELLEDLFKRKITVLFPSPKKLRDLILGYCRQYPQIETCRDVFLLINGNNNRKLTPEDLTVAISYHPARTSVKCLLHYLQTIIAGKFQHFDYHREENLRRYNSTTPPLYDLGRITVPTHMFYALNDFLVSPKDVELIFGQLKTRDKSMNLVPKSRKIRYNHADFIHGVEIEKFLYGPLFKVIGKLNKDL